MLFDIRSDEEYSISHLAGSVRIDPAADRQQFIDERRATANHHTVVFYCTSSGRSQAFADRVLHALVDAGANDVFVLDGGIIAWSNARLSLVGRDGATEFLHPHDTETAKLLDRPWLIRFGHREF